MKKRITILVLFIALLTISVSYVYANETVSELDKIYYAVSGIKSAGGWDEVKVTDLPDGKGSHIEFKNCNYTTYRTMGKRSHKLDGMHIMIENFKGDGIGVAFSVSQAPDAYDKAVRFFSFNNTYGDGKLRDTSLQMCYPVWPPKPAIDLKAPQIASKIEIRMDKKNATTWIYNFNGEEFEVSNSDIESAIDDVDNVFVSFSAYGGTETIDNYSFDLMSAHGGNDVCANTLSTEEIKSVEAVITKINNIGKVVNTPECLEKISSTKAAYNNLPQKLCALVTNRDELSYAESNYYVLNHEPSFNDNDVVSSFYAISDNHVDTNGCTSVKDGTPLDRLGKAMSIMNKNKPDAMLIAGDMTDWARFAIDENDPDKAKTQINKYKLAVLDNLDDNIKIFTTMGNHDSTNGSNVELFNRLLGDRFYQADVNKDTEEWKKNGFRHAVIKGFNYLSVEWDYTDEIQDISPAAINFMERKLIEITTAPNYTNQPIFILSHVPFASGLFGCESEAGTPNKDKLYKVLANYPQIVYLAGHTHYPLNQETAIFQSDFTMLATATTAYTCLPGQSFLLEGGYKIGGLLMPKDLILSQGIYVQIDNLYNIKVSRIDFLRNGETIFNTFIVPSPDLANKTHLNYYGANRKSAVNQPKFATDAFINAATTGPTDIRIIFDTAKNDTAVDHYVFDLLKDGELISTYKSYTGTWRYTKYSDVPNVMQVDIPDINIQKPYTVRVRGVDEYGNESAFIETIVAAAGESDRVFIDEVDRLIAAIGAVTIDSKPDIDKALQKYNLLDYDKKAMLKNESKLIAAQRTYEDLFMSFEQYYNNVSVSSTVLGENFWLPQGWLSYSDDPKGININYTNAIPNVRVGLKKFNLDGLHLTFDRLIKGNMDKDPSIGIIIGGNPHPEFNEKSDGGFLLFLDTNEGKLEGLEGNKDIKMIIKSDELKYKNLKEKEWSLKFSKQEDGNFLIDLNGQQGILDKAFFEGGTSATNSEEVYISLSCWIADGNFSYRLMSAHDKNSACYNEGVITLAEITKIESVTKLISELGEIKLTSKDKIVAAEAIYSQITNKGMVKNASALLEARQVYDKLFADSQIPPDPINPGDGDPDKKPVKKGCGSSVLGEFGGGIFIICAFAAIYIALKRKKA